MNRGTVNQKQLNISGKQQNMRVALACCAAWIVLMATALVPVYADAPTPTGDEALIGDALIGDALIGDALIAPDLPQTALLTSAQASAAAGFYQTSEYMIGRVAVGVFLVESDGSGDPSSEDWSEQEIAQVRAQIVSATQWWTAREPAAHLSWVFDERLTSPQPTRYEPISRPYADQKLWIGEVMARLGYTGDSYFSQVRAYVNDLRAFYQTDWAFAIFVIDSSNDADGALADGRSAYAYIGGPFLVLTLDNSGYGVERMEQVAAHEIGHIFMAVDQYAAAGLSCTLSAGYLGVENQNSQAGRCLSDQPSIMRSLGQTFAQGQVDFYARGQLGWWDSDQDGILDPLDTSIYLDLARLPVLDEGRPVYRGWAADVPFPSPRRQAVTIDRIADVQYRLDGGEWMPAQPQDGAFDSVVEEFGWTLPVLPDGLYLLDVLVRTRSGQEHVILAADTALIVASDRTAPFQKVQCVLSADRRLVCGGLAAALQGVIVNVQVRLDDAVWESSAAMDGSFDAALEAFTYVAAMQPGVHVVSVQAVDSAGRLSPLYQETFNAPMLHQVYLPLVLRGQ